ncbi:MAG: hypothetical protein ACJAVM_002182 [Sulfitobacter sp.]
MKFQAQGGSSLAPFVLIGERDMMGWKLAVIGLVFGALATATEAQNAQAEAPLGLWKSQPDGRGVVLNVRTKPCGRALCGRVERVKDRRGYDTPSSMVGQKVFRDLKPQPDGGFLGKMIDRKGNIQPEARVWLQGNELHLRACDEGRCEVQVWTRLR